MKVYIDNRQDTQEIDEKTIDLLKDVIEKCLVVEGRDLNYEISLSFVTNEEIKNLNKEYRNVDAVTDVLSFPMEEDSNGFYTPMLGDIVISTDRAFQQSKEYGHSFSREISYLTAHSMFHLMGYDHETEEEKKTMRAKEKEVMRSLGIFKETKEE
ncbi:rRNA maturation RNase YbeY [Sporanaerobacter sp. PP17-6a]|jgi:probable rRNA maturation factor|uniref:rRNA maturation RNase YbeY n=1 Tax=Sporanaerobacter sp. PP17-6a TaxID=1891289 RepID=UPI0008A012B5|nr:rRNA maturation RNase YbeY [Sporanaerobacter sp. PP17-6a]SCL84487.1 Endoribonuclease YbeY [Sporanaerobacter sp. PP17-6a]